MVLPQPGFKLVIGDYSQIELRIAAEISHDMRMIEAFKNRRDLHKLTASVILEKDITLIAKEERQSAEPVNFGLICAMGAHGLCDYAQEAYGVSLTIEQSQRFREKFFETYTGIAVWHETIKQSWETETRTILGRRRQWQDSPGITKLLTSPVQGTSADIIKKALALLNSRLGKTGAMIVGCVHDEIILEVPDAMTDEIALILKETMEEAGRMFLRIVPVEAEVVIASSWAGK